MDAKYAKYTSRELLEDDSFIHSMINPSEETNKFWNSLLVDGILDFDEFQEARSFVLFMQRPRKVMSAKEKNDLWVQIEIRNKKNLRRRLSKKFVYIWSICASFLIILSALSFVFFSRNQDTLDFHEVMADVSTVNESKDIQLILPDNKTIELEEKSVDIELDKEGGVFVNSKQLAASAMPEKEEAISYNQLIVPMGRHSRLTLSDGTKMYVNAGSTVVFPHKFKKKEREIFVDGEVYLEVARNKDVPFNVRTTAMDVKVLGTSFNIRAYKEDDEQAVVLVSGSVQVYTKDKHKVILSPDQKFGYSDGEYFISAIDSDNYISWIHGYYSYRQEPLVNIMKQISRYYGADIICGEKVGALTCTGKLDLKKDLDILMNDLVRPLELELKKEENIYYIN